MKFQDRTVMMRKPLSRNDSDAPTLDDLGTADTLPPKMPPKFEPAQEIEEHDLPNWFMWGLAVAATASLWLIALS